MIWCPTYQTRITCMISGMRMWDSQQPFCNPKRMDSNERITWRKYSDKIYEIISASDAARNSLVSKLCAAGLVAENVKIQVQGQAAITGANTLVNEISTSINIRETKFHEIISVMACVEQLKEVAETMRKDAAILGMCKSKCVTSVAFSTIQSLAYHLCC